MRSATHTHRSRAVRFAVRCWLLTHCTVSYLGLYAFVTRDTHLSLHTLHALTWRFALVTSLHGPRHTHAVGLSSHALDASVSPKRTRHTFWTHPHVAQCVLTFALHICCPSLFYASHLLHSHSFGRPYSSLPIHIHSHTFVVSFIFCYCYVPSHIHIHPFVCSCSASHLICSHILDTVRAFFSPFAHVFCDLILHFHRLSLPHISFLPFVGRSH